MARRARGARRRSRKAHKPTSRGPHNVANSVIERALAARKKVEDREVAQKRAATEVEREEVFTDPAQVIEDNPQEKPRWRLDLWRTAFAPLFAHIGREPLLVMISTAFVDIVEKVDNVERDLGMKVVWISKNVRGFMKSTDGRRMICDIGTLLNALHIRRQVNNVIFLTVHSAVTFDTLYKLKELVPNALRLSYVYDWMQLFVPRERKDLWKAYDPGGKGWGDREYNAIDDVIAGNIVDGILHKDYGDEFPLLKDCKAAGGALWFPPVLPQRLFQKPPPLSIPNRICYIGTVVSKKTHKRDSGLFDDIFIEDLFDKVSTQGWQIDAYSLGVPDDVHEEFKERFPSGRVKLYNGVLLGRLLPLLSGRYKFGWMLYDYPQQEIMEHIKVTIPAKLFTYFALGIPPLISEEMEACCRIVKKYGCGVVVRRGEAEEINKRLEQEDYEKLQEGVLKVRDELNVQSYQPKFSAYIANLLNVFRNGRRVIDEKAGLTDQKYLEQERKHARPNQ